MNTNLIRSFRKPRSQKRHWCLHLPSIKSAMITEHTLTPRAVGTHSLPQFPCTHILFQAVKVWVKQKFPCPFQFKTEGKEVTLTPPQRSYSCPLQFPLLTGRVLVIFVNKVWNVFSLVFYENKTNHASCTSFGLHIYSLRHV